MEPGEALDVAAQIAVALAGFAGVVVAFRRGALHEWSPIDRYRLWLLLANSAVPVLCCFFGITLLTMKPVPVSIWRWCSGFSFVMTILFFVMITRASRGLGPAVIRGLGSYRYFYYLLAVLGTAVTALQVYNMVAVGAFVLFYIGIAFQLSAGLVQFVRMILLSPNQE
jgi:hypothetical protein